MEVTDSCLISRHYLSENSELPADCNADGNVVDEWTSTEGSHVIKELVVGNEYVGELFGNMSLDDIFERFNIDRPEDFRGHSLSVSDIVVLNEGGKVTAHFVDSISFEQLDSFLNLEEQVLSELAYEVGERYFAIQRTEEGYDYSFYDEDFRLMDGGVYENDEISIEEAAEELLEDEGWTGERIRGDYDRLMEKVEEMDEVVMAEIQKSQGEYKPLAKKS